MRSLIKNVAYLALVCAGIHACGTSQTVRTTASSNLPQDVLQSCVVSPEMFNSWFASGKATENGFVTPANSVTFVHDNNCDFYRWSEQMFLWLTSSSSGVYGNGGTVLESALFYDVSPADASGQRTLMPHQTGIPFRMDNHLLKNGPHRLPVIRDKAGKLFEVETLPGRAKVKDADGKITEVHGIDESTNGRSVLRDKLGKVIRQPTAIVGRHRQRTVQKIQVGTRTIFLDAAGNQIQTEEGQATGNALMAQNGSLVYYLTMVNDVYAFFLTGSKNGRFSRSQFPTTAPARDSICALARANHVQLPDSNALAIELKTSWVEAKNLPNASSYITVDATIPTYDTTSNREWVPTGERVAKMALVGMHIVGSVAGHPEMIWATFEHKKNTPNASYAYLDADSTSKTVPQDTGEGWLFSNSSSGSVNVPHMSANGDTLSADSIFTISASNTLRAMPWGSAMDSLTNQQDRSSAASNSEVISLNNTIQQLLAGSDIRKNYLFIGATWTQGGAAPNGSNYGTDTIPGVAIGTSALANSTMETYLQGPSNSCLFCHSVFDRAHPSLSPDTISHIFTPLQPLSLATVATKKKKP
ncbi:hypothetical protein [Spirosoma validum]|uniref:Cytochrome c family protein n=1 Tax=Spirosoma validum TaxID=2771355 RepID=A0A927B860_9BACT|nr:hypothetical protein [Spirosoma validum]MBD2757139.1 hypothetical protein [Spirosoma validum]